MRRGLVLLAWLIAVYAMWLGMMAAHELGHVIHAWISGERVLRVSVPLVGFSQTHLAGGRPSAFVVWGGFVWGCALPLLLTGVARAVNRGLGRPAAIFGGFCLIANGAYLAVGGPLGTGDALDLARSGVPRWVMILLGSSGVWVGLFIWHRVRVRVLPTWPVRRTATNTRRTSE